MNATRNPTNGFSLIELLVALAIFAAVSALAYGGLDGVVRANQALESDAKQWRQVQLALSVFERELSQAAMRDVRNEYGEVQVSMRGNARELEWVRIGSESILHPERSALARVRYGLADDAWHRAEAEALDFSPQSRWQDKVLLEAIDETRLRYLDFSNQWQSQWPVSSRDPKREPLPRAVELQLKGKAIGEIRRVIELGQMPAPIKGPAP